MGSARRKADKKDTATAAIVVEGPEIIVREVECKKSLQMTNSAVSHKRYSMRENSYLPNSNTEERVLTAITAKWMAIGRVCEQRAFRPRAQGRASICQNIGGKTSLHGFDISSRLIKPGTTK